MKIDQLFPENRSNCSKDALSLTKKKEKKRNLNFIYIFKFGG